MKIIFLDIDGVLNSIESSVGMNSIGIEIRMDTVDPTKVGLLKFACEQTGAKIVISSTWRFGRNEDWFKDFFEKRGWSDFPIVGMTPVSSDDTRGEEVAKWLHDHPNDVSAWIAVDDDNDFHDEQVLVQTSGVRGLTLKEVIEMIDHLGIDEGHGDPAQVESLRRAAFERDNCNV